jgi:hypothetical protein
MKKKVKKKIKGFFTKPLFLLFLAVILWALLMGLSTSFIFSRVKREAKFIITDAVNKAIKQASRARTVVQDVEVYHRISINDIKTRLSADASSEIATGSIINHSGKTIRSIKIKLLFYDSKKNIIDIIETTEITGQIKPVGLVQFSVLRRLGKAGEPKETTVQKRSASVTGSMTDFELEEKEQ